MKANRRLKLTTNQFLTHYWIVLFLLIIFLVITGQLVEEYITEASFDLQKVTEEINILLILLSLALIFTIVQYKRLRFKVFNVSYTPEQFNEAIERTANEMDWRIKNNSKTIFRAVRLGNWSGSWGEMVTIIKLKDRLLINSICDPDGRGGVFSYGWNKKNVESFRKHLTDVLNGVPLETKKAEVINEWSLKRTLIRIIAYPFCLALIVIGGYMVLVPSSISTIIFGLVVLSIAGIYLYADLKIISSKNDNQRSSIP